MQLLTLGMGRADIRNNCFIFYIVANIVCGLLVLLKQRIMAKADMSRTVDIPAIQESYKLPLIRIKRLLRDH